MSNHSKSIKDIELHLGKELIDSVVDATVNAIFGCGWTSFRTTIQKQQVASYRYRIVITIEPCSAVENDNEHD